MKWTNRIITGLVIVLFILVLLLLISTIYYSLDEKMEIGSLTDWISAFCNIAMAGAAVYAAMKAIHFFKEKAFDHAQNILSKFNDLKVDFDIFHFDLINATSLKLPSFHQNISAPFTLTFSDENEVRSIIPEEIKELDDRLVILRKHSLNLIVSLNSTKRYSFIMKPEYKESIAFTLSEYNNLTAMHLLSYKRLPEVILPTVIVSGKKRIDNDQYEALEHLNKTLHDTYLEFDNDINNIFIFK